MLSVTSFSGQSAAADTKDTQTRLRSSYVEDIAAKILRSSSQSGWPYLKWQWICYFYV